MQSDCAEDHAFLKALFRTLNDTQMLLAIDERLVDMQFVSRELQYRQQYPDASFQLVLIDGLPAGRIAVDRSRDLWRLIDIAIMPRWQNQGIGSSLVESLLHDATERQCDVCASVAAHNVDAQRLWQRFGFEVTDRRDDYWSLRFCPSDNR